jgi:tRNA(Ile)-lysidine synthase
MLPTGPDAGGRASGPLLVGVSGGLDSVVLAHALKELGFSIHLAHVHHGLREDSADEDQELVKRLAGDWRVPFSAVRIAIDRQPASLQQSAREARYRALGQLAVEVGTSHVAVAHHADDQAETLLINLARGSGPSGLGAMRAEARFPSPEYPELVLVRPLLETPKAKLRTYATHQGLTWREDPTNLDEHYRRNALRARVIPALEDVFGAGVTGNLARAASLMAAYEQSEIGGLSRTLLRLVSRPLDGRHLRADGCLLHEGILTELPEVWRHRVILDALAMFIPDASRASAEAASVAALLGSQVGKMTFCGSGEVWREREGLALVARRDSPVGGQLAPGCAMDYSRYRMTARPIETASKVERNRVSFPGREPFQVRAWEAGDTIRTPGGLKKVKDVLTEFAYPCFSRDTAPVVVSSGQVVWLPGLVADPQRCLPEGGGPGVELTLEEH